MNFDLFKNQKENKIIRDNKADFAVSDELYIKLIDSSKIDLDNKKIPMSPLTVGFISFLLDDINYKRLKSNFLKDNKNSIKVCIIKDSKLDVVTEFSKVDIVILNDDRQCCKFLLCTKSESLS